MSDLHVDIVDIRTAQLDIAAAMDFVSDPRFGGIASFIGRVRGHNLGRVVTGISYDLFEPLALKNFRDIGERAKAEIGDEPMKIWITHAQGRLSLRDPAVVVAVGTPHRDEAFRACRMAIEALKHESPIWKQEHYVDGDSVWSEGCSLCEAHREAERTPRRKRPNTMPIATDTLPCIGVVLAGGRSQRMGRDKALLTWHGRPLIEHQLVTLEAAGVAHACVSGKRPAYQGVPDPLQRAGPLAGIAGVANDITGDADLLVIPVDMPLLLSPLLTRLRTEKPQARSLTFAARVLPLRLRLDATTRPLLHRLMAADDPRKRSLRALHRAVGTDTIALDAGEMSQLTDCNTPTAWYKVTA